VAKDSYQAGLSQLGTDYHGLIATEDFGEQWECRLIHKNETTARACSERFLRRVKKPSKDV
jgi:hypothetical protein